MSFLFFSRKTKLCPNKSKEQSENKKKYKLSYILGIQNPIGFKKSIMDHVDILFFQYMFVSLLMKIKIPFHFIFHLLSTSLRGNPPVLDCLLAKLMHALKVTSSVSVFLIRVNIETVKKILKKDDEL